MTSNLDLLRRLAHHGLEHVLVGEMAGVVHGRTRAPFAVERLEEIRIAPRSR